MAEFRQEGGLDNYLSSNENVLNVECAVCLQTCVHPAELPCGHVFCYLCIKGIVNQGRRCAMCRQDIPVDYLDKPRLLNPMDIELTSQGFEDGHLWFYEGNNGWWQYDERTSLELESAYQKGERCCDLLIAGFLYVADFDGMLQYRKNDPSRRRRIKRDLATTTKKGIAGLKSTKICNMISSNHLDVVSNEVIQNLPVPNSSLLNNLSGVRIFNSVANDSGQGVETMQHTEESRERSCGCSLSSCRPANLTYSNVGPQIESSVSYARNLNLDNVIHDTLDWTIEQIESLNLELLNEYEALFRDVNNYAQLQDNLNQTSYRRTNNYMRRYLNLSIPSSESYESDLNSTVRELDVSNLSNSVLNNSAFELSADETNHINSELNGSQTDRTLQSSAASSSSVPASRSRGMARTKLGEILHNIH